MRDSFDTAGPAPDDAGSAKAGVTPGDYVNPILDCDFPDPAILRDADGFYYAYGTQTLRDGEWVNIQVARSKDLIDWEFLGDALPEKPDWARTTQDFWAPSAICDGDIYFMYYSATPDS